ncbi:hypothetical protein FCV25MIE_22275 [Fagus crenata]
MSMTIFFSFLRGPIMTPHCTTGFDAKQNPRRLFPNRIVLLFRHLSLRRGRHHPPNIVESDNMEMVRAPLLRIAR